MRKPLQALTPNSWEGAVLLCAASCFYFSEVCCTCVSRQAVHVAGTRTRTQAFQACLYIAMYMLLRRMSYPQGLHFQACLSVLRSAVMGTDWARTALLYAFIWLGTVVGQCANKCVGA